MDTLAVRLTVPPIRPVWDFHPQVIAPCRAHHKKARLNRWLAGPLNGNYILDTQIMLDKHPKVVYIIINKNGAYHYLIGKGYENKTEKD
jgi:hypothetical protein